MAEYNTLNYTEQGGAKTVIGGELSVTGTENVTGNLVIKSGGKLKFGTTEFKQAANVAKAAGTAPTKAEFDALIDAFVAAGIMKST